MMGPYSSLIKFNQDHRVVCSEDSLLTKNLKKGFNCLRGTYWYSFYLNLIEDSFKPHKSYKLMLEK